MKTAVSLPDDLFERLERCARRLKLSRSGLLATAAREFLARHDPDQDATEAWNRAIDEAGQPGADPGAAAGRRHSLATLRRRRSRERW